MTHQASEQVMDLPVLGSEMKAGAAVAGMMAGPASRPHDGG
jgi:hypothetical protein